MKQKNGQAITNLQMLIALRLDERIRLEKIIVNDNELEANKSIARARLVELERDDVADLAELERLRARYSNIGGELALAIAVHQAALCFAYSDGPHGGDQFCGELLHRRLGTFDGARCRTAQPAGVL